MIHAVTCRTQGCVNEGYTLTLNRPGHSVHCGPCNQPITDVQPPIPEGGYPPEEEPQDPEEEE